MCRISARSRSRHDDGRNAGGSRAPRGAAGNAARSARLGAGGGCRAGRAVRPVSRLPRRIRAVARGLHADLGKHHHGRGARRRAGRHAADHRNADLRLRDVRDGRAGEPDRQDPLHVRRAGAPGRGGADAAWHLAQFRRAAFADAGRLVHPYPRPRRRHALHPRRYGGAAGLGHPQRRSGAVLRPEEPLPAEGRGAGGDRANPLRAGAPHAGRHGPDHRHLVRHHARGGGGSGGSGGARHIRRCARPPHPLALGRGCGRGLPVSDRAAAGGA